MAWVWKPCLGAKALSGAQAGVVHWPSLAASRHLRSARSALDPHIGSSYGGSFRPLPGMLRRSMELAELTTVHLRECSSLSAVSEATRLVSSLPAVSEATRLVPAILIGAALLAGCGESRQDGATGSLASSNRSVKVHPETMTPAKARRIRSAALHNGFVRQVASGSEIRVSQQVVPCVTGGRRSRLVGGAVQIYLTPPVSVVNQRLPGTISPNEKAPPGTHTLHRYVLLSGTNIGQLEVEIRLKSGRANRIEPSGSGYDVTKFELIGPPPKNPAYAPEPGY